MRPPIPLVSSHLFVDDLRGEVSQLWRIFSFWLTAALISCGIVGVGILCSGIAVGAELHKSGFVVGGVLAVLCLLHFAALQEAWGTVALLLSLLEFDDAISREDILKKLTDYMQKHTSAKRAKSAVVPENVDFDEATLQAMEVLPVKLLGVVTSALQVGPAAVSVASAVCAVIIFLLRDVPDQVAALPVAFASLAILGGMCGFYVRIRAAVLIRKIACQQMDFNSTNQSPGVSGPLHHTHQFSPCPGFDLPLRATLLELYMNMLRRKLASTAQGQALARECMRLTVQNVQNPMLGPAGRQPIVAAIQRGWLSGLSLDELESCVFSYARAAASLCDLEVMDQVIDECLILLPQDRLQEALATRKTIQELQDNLHCSIQRRDVAALCDAIVRCESYGWPSKRLEEAYVAKCQLQQLIARLRFAADAGDLEMLSRVVKECEGLGLPERDLKAAKQRKEQLEALSGQLQAAVEAKKLGKLNEALAAAQAVDLKHDLVATAHILRDELNALLLRLSEETRKSDIDGLRDAIQSCQRADLLDDDCGVDCVLTKAQQSLAELEELMLGLNFAVQSRDLARLEDFISKCETKGVPPRYFHRAAHCQKEILSLMNNLDSARKGLDLGSLDQAIQECRIYGLPQAAFEEALTVRRRIHAVHSELKLVVESRDVEKVEAMIAECRNLGLPEQDFLDACKLKQIMDEMLVQLRACVGSQDVPEMDRQIKVCEDFGIVSHEIHSAKVQKLKIQELLQQLQASVSRQDLAALRTVLKDCKESNLRQEYMEEALDLKAHMRRLVGIWAEFAERLLRAKNAGFPQLSLQMQRGCKQSLKTCLGSCKKVCLPET